MPRKPRVVVPGMPHHVVQRGNRGVDVFFTDDDHQQYLVWLAEYAERRDLAVWAYCLMSNHVHLVVVPGRHDSLARAFGPLHTRHSQRMNTEYEWAGHLWQGRYFSCPLDDGHLWAAVRYVERNPVEAGLVDTAPEYAWSSAPVRCGLRRDPVLSSDMPLLEEIDDWADWLGEPEDEQVVALLRERTEKGLPCGSDAFVSEIGVTVGRSLAQRPKGRPKKSGGKDNNED